jgi:hypothetical protein
MFPSDHVAGDKLVLGDHERGVIRRRTLLMLSADPAGEQSLRLDEKRRAIDPTVRDADGPPLPWQPGR